VQYAHLITLYGLALSLLGWPAFSIIAVPLLIVLFMIPLPQFCMANLSTALANYVNSTGGALNLYISWYESQRKGEAVHSSRPCLPGGGWQMRDFGQSELPGTSIEGLPLRVNRLLFELGNHRRLVYY
jgi:EpsI family protein